MKALDNFQKGLVKQALTDFKKVRKPSPDDGHTCWGDDAYQYLSDNLSQRIMHSIPNGGDCPRAFNNFLGFLYKD